MVNLTPASGHESRLIINRPLGFTGTIETVSSDLKPAEFN